MLDALLLFMFGITYMIKGIFCSLLSFEQQKRLKIREIESDYDFIGAFDFEEARGIFFTFIA